MCIHAVCRLKLCFLCLLVTLNAHKTIECLAIFLDYRFRILFTEYDIVEAKYYSQLKIYSGEYASSNRSTSSNRVSSKTANDEYMKYILYISFEWYSLIFPPL